MFGLRLLALANKNCKFVHEIWIGILNIEIELAQ
jgi:hypothetical protein